MVTSSKSTSSRNTNSSKTRKSGKKEIMRRNIQGFVATFMGIAVGVPMAVAALTPVIKAEVAADTSGLSRTVNVAPADDLTTCSQPASTSTPAPAGGSGAGVSSNVAPASNPLPQLPGNSNNVTKEFKQIGNFEANTTASIADTGPGSTNEITTTNTNTTTVTNDNNVNVANVNLQGSSSGDATVKNNTNAGSAGTGDTSNTNSSSTNVSIQN